MAPPLNNPVASAYEQNSVYQTPKIGIGIPVHVHDRNVFEAICFPSLEQLNPKPSLIMPYFNRGPDLQTVRRRMFDKLFRNYSCDVAMTVSADYYLFPTILRYVDVHRVTTFPFLSKHPRDMPLTLATLLGFGWSACFSVPRALWPHIREHLKHDDSDVKNCLSPSQIKRVRLPKFYEYRYAQGTPRTAWEIHRKKRLLSRVRWIALRMAKIQ